MKLLWLAIGSLCADSLQVLHQLERWWCIETLHKEVTIRSLFAQYWLTIEWQSNGGLGFDSGASAPVRSLNINTVGSQGLRRCSIVYAR